MLLFLLFVLDLKEDNLELVENMVEEAGGSDCIDCDECDDCSGSYAGYASDDLGWCAKASTLNTWEHDIVLRTKVSRRRKFQQRPVVL